MTVTESELTTEDLILSVSDEALVVVYGELDKEEEPETIGLRVEIIGAQGVDYNYELTFETIADAADDDVIYTLGERPLTVIVPAATVDNLRGATLDLPSNPMQGGLVIRNPNRPSAVDGDVELTGTIPEKVTQLLERHINPSLSMHGGFATLEKVEDTTVYLSMGGGCQGCSMSAATLRDGIIRAISETIPEVTEVIDTTEHELGESPYFE